MNDKWGACAVRNCEPESEWKKDEAVGFKGIEVAAEYIVITHR